MQLITLKLHQEGRCFNEHFSTPRNFFRIARKKAAEIAELFRGFLTTLGGKRAGVLRDAHKTAAD